MISPMRILSLISEISQSIRLIFSRVSVSEFPG